MQGKFEFGLPIIDLEVNGENIIAILDTGFNGQLLLPKRLIEKLNLDIIGSTDYMSVDGTRQFTSIYKATVKINDKSLAVDVVSSNSNAILAGTLLFKEFRIILEQRKDLVLIEG